MERTKEILTKTQELALYEKTLEALKELINAPESHDLINDIKIGTRHDEMFGIQYLMLTNTGLVKECPYWKSNRDSGKRYEEPTVDLVREFNLKETKLKRLLAKLKA